MHRYAVSSTPSSRILSSLLILAIIALQGVSSAAVLHSSSDSSTDLSDAVVLKAVEIPEDRVTYEGAQVWRVVATNEQRDFVSYLQDTGDVQTWSGNRSAIDVLVRPDFIPRVSRFLRERRVNYDVIITDLQQAIDQENPIPSQESMEELEGRKARHAWWKGTGAKVPGTMRLRVRVWVWAPRYPSPYPVPRYPVASSDISLWRHRGHRMEWSSYHHFDDISGYLDYLAETFPDLCSVMSIGNSVEGRPLKVLRISNGERNAPAMWIDGGIHAREWISPAAVTYIINYLVENSDNLEMDYYILPVVNPDGYEYTFRGDRMWRKNRSSPEKGGICIGVDLNRNFGYRWGGLGSSKQPCRDTYAGSGPFSEPETKAIQNFFETSGANFKAYVSFHSYGQYILYPWGYDQRVPPDYADLERVGRQAAAAMKSAGGAASAYTVGNSATTLYPASGGSDDFAKGIMHIKYAYTIEMRDKGRYGFVLPAKFIIETGKEALAAVLVVAENAKAAP